MGKQKKEKEKEKLSENEERVRIYNRLRMSEEAECVRDAKQR